MKWILKLRFKESNQNKRFVISQKILLSKNSQIKSNIFRIFIVSKISWYELSIQILRIFSNIWSFSYNVWNTDIYHRYNISITNHWADNDLWNHCISLISNRIRDISDELILKWDRDSSHCNISIFWLERKLL